MIILVALALVLTMVAVLNGAGPGRGGGIDSWITDLGTDQRLAGQPRISWQAGRGDAERRSSSTRRAGTNAWWASAPR